MAQKNFKFNIGDTIYNDFGIKTTPKRVITKYAFVTARKLVFNGKEFYEYSYSQFNKNSNTLITFQDADLSENLFLTKCLLIEKQIKSYIGSKLILFDI
jgi:hypothetical protein